MYKFYSILTQSALVTPHPVLIARLMTSYLYTTVWYTSAFLLGDCVSSQSVRVQNCNKYQVIERRHSRRNSCSGYRLQQQEMTSATDVNTLTDRAPAVLTKAYRLALLLSSLAAWRTAEAMQEDVLAQLVLYHHSDRKLCIK